MALNIGTKKIAELTALEELQDGDLFVVQRGEDTCKVSKQNGLDKQHTQFLHTFAAGSFVAATRTGWDGWFVSSKNVTVYNKSGSVRAAGASLDVPPTNDMMSQVSEMCFYIISDNPTVIEAYAKSVPVVDVVVSIEGVQ